ncbi:MAG: nucleotidyltransferase substrate binding protein [Paludibacteraceae bacterium]|nr:nucleotidyltransferase substrate binding protein [Paludibacteraceae bacterium]
MPNNETDIRWQQRFANYRKALKKLSDAVDYVHEEMDAGAEMEELDDLKLEGLIQRFEYTHELAWNVMKDYVIYQGNNSITGSRDAIREAISMGLITDQRWMNTIGDRNRTSHTYNESTTYEILDDIVNVYFPLFVDFETKMEELRSGE